MTRSNTADLVGTTALVEEDHPDRFLPDLLWEITVRDDSPLTPAFLADFLATTTGRRLLQTAAMGTSGSMKKLSMARVRRLHVPAVPLELQQGWERVRWSGSRVASAIGAIVTAKRELKRGLKHELLTGQRRFSEFTREGPWMRVELGEVVESVTRRNAKGSTELVLTCSGEHGLVDQRNFFSKTVAGDSREGYFLLRRGEFAYNRSAMSGYPYGAIKRLDRYEAGVLSTLNICFALKGDAWVSDFAVHVFESGLLNQQLGRITRVGSRAHGLLNVTKSDFFALEVPVPSVAEQELIAGVLNTMDREIELLERLQAQYEIQKRGLMQRLLSGEIPIPESFAAPPELAHA